MKHYRTGQDHCFANADPSTLNRWTVRVGVGTATSKDLGPFLKRNLARYAASDHEERGPES
jgi:hypothetical protein